MGYAWRRGCSRLLVIRFPKADIVKNNTTEGKELKAEVTLAPSIVFTVWVGITFSKKSQQTLTCFCCRSDHSLTSSLNLPDTGSNPAKWWCFGENIFPLLLSLPLLGTLESSNMSWFTAAFTFSVQTTWISNCPCRETISGSLKHYGHYAHCVSAVIRITTMSGWI